MKYLKFLFYQLPLLIFAIVMLLAGAATALAPHYWENLKKDWKWY